MKWTDEQREVVFTLWRQGLSPNEIATRIRGATRCAVIGVVHRAGLKRDDPAASYQPRKKPEPRPRAGLIIAGCGAVLEKPPAAPSTFIPKPDAFKPLAGSRPIPWTERGFGQCAWPVDVEAEEQHSCALRCADGETYCATHLKLRTAPQAPGKPKRSPQELIRALRRYA